MRIKNIAVFLATVLLLLGVACTAVPAGETGPSSASTAPAKSETDVSSEESAVVESRPEGNPSSETPFEAFSDSSSGQAMLPSAPEMAQGLFSQGYPQAQVELEKMTLEEKVAQVFLFRCPSEGALSTVQTYQPGGFMLFAKDFDGKTADQVRMELESYQNASKIPLFLAVDEEGGTVVRVSRNPNLAPNRFESPQQVFEQGGMQAIVEDTVQKTQLLQSLGVNVNLAPVADVSINPGDFMCARTFGQDAPGTAEYVKTSVKTYNQQRMACALKHFPGYGNNVDTHTGMAQDHRPLETFTDSDFLPFEAGIAEGVPMILVSHNIVTCMDPDRPASLSPEVHRILREDLGFTGLILTDDLAMEAIPDYTGGENPCAAALNAGNDLLLSSNVQEDYNALLEAVQNGTVTEERLNEAVLRILAMKYCTQYQWERVVG